MVVIVRSQGVKTSACPDLQLGSELVPEFQVLQAFWHEWIQHVAKVVKTFGDCRTIRNS